LTMGRGPPSAGGLACYERPGPPAVVRGFELLQQGPCLKFQARRAEDARDFSTPFSFFTKAMPSGAGEARRSSAAKLIDAARRCSFFRWQNQKIGRSAAHGRARSWRPRSAADRHRPDGRSDDPPDEVTPCAGRHAAAGPRLRRPPRRPESSAA